MPNLHAQHGTANCTHQHHSSCGTCHQSGTYTTPGAMHPPPAVACAPPTGSTVMPCALSGSAGAPDIAGVGRTAGEEQLRQAAFGQNNKMYEAQEFKPADEDPSRLYHCREVDGNWTLRNRYTIDNMGDCRWYMADGGWFYAVRLAN